MSSFSCPHYDANHDDCLRLECECVPGRPGCVLFKNSVFAVPWEQRLAAKQQDRAAQDDATRAGSAAGDRSGRSRGESAGS